MISCSRCDSPPPKLWNNDLTISNCYLIMFQGAWVLKPRNLQPKSVVHFIGGIFVGAAPQLTYRLFLERLSEK